MAPHATIRRLSQDGSSYHPPHPIPAASSPFYNWPRQRAHSAPGTPPSSPTQPRVVPVQAVLTTPQGRSETALTGNRGPVPAPVFTREPSEQGISSTTSNVKVSEFSLYFTLSARTPEEQDVQYKCTRSDGPHKLRSPPVTPTLKAPGDVHVHTYMGGIQHWVLGSSITWIAAKIGDPHPSVADRVLSHQEPQGVKFPKWVLPATLATYRTRSRHKVL